MTIDAKTTTKALKAEVIPLLKASGFDDWTGRKAWRRRAGCIDTIEFRSISSYDSMVISCPTASLGVWFASWPDCFAPPSYPIKQGPKGPRPQEAEMPLRGYLMPPPDRAARMQPQIWRIASEEEADAAARDIATQLRENVLDWLSRDWDGAAILAALLARTSVADKLLEAPSGANMWIDCGNAGSPAHNRTMAGVLAGLGRYAEAAELYEDSRYALNHTTQTRRLYLEPEDDQILQDLAAACRAKAKGGKPDVL